MEGKLEKLADYRTDKLKYWNPEDFEDELTKGIISLFESKFKRNRDFSKQDRLNENLFKRIQKSGVNITSPDRYAFEPTQDDGSLSILPMDILEKASFGTASCPWAIKEGFYFMHQYVEKWNHPLPKLFKRTGGGQIYIHVEAGADNYGISGSRYFFTLEKNGTAHPCEMTINTGCFNRIGIPLGEQKENFGYCIGRVEKALLVMQLVADSKYTWTISAIEEGRRVNMGVLESEVKSLAYARSMPLTATGRKRPILHFVSAHKRRLQNGTDIDINEYKRGIVRFEMNGTQFEVKPPIIRNEVQ